MISLLRKIRQKLLQEGKVINYLKNAVVEIFLGAELIRHSPFWDLIWVEQSIGQAPAVPLGLPVPQAGTGYIRNLSELQIIWRTCLPDRQAYGTLFLFIYMFLPIFCPPK